MGRIIRRFGRDKAAMAALVVLLLLVIFAFVVPVFWPYRYDVYTSDNSFPPSLQHPFGTDSTGYDMLAKSMRGAQRSLLIALTVAISATVIGSVIGALSALVGGGLDSAIMRVVDVILVFPSIAVAAVFSYLSIGTQTSWQALALVLILISWPPISRVVRSAVLIVVEQDYVLAARGLGVSTPRMLARHVLPNVVGPVFVAMTVLCTTAILSETALSYLGFGIRPPDTSLGLLVADAQGALSTRPWLFYFPGIVIVLIALSSSFVGEGLRKAMDSRSA